MEVVWIVLNETEYLNEILSLFLEYDIRGATVIDSAGMGHLIANRSPMFSMFADLQSKDNDNSKTIMTVVNSDDERDKALQAVENILGDLTEPDSAVFFTTPVTFQKGMNLD